MKVNGIEYFYFGCSRNQINTRQQIVSVAIICYSKYHELSNAGRLPKRRVGINGIVHMY